MSKYLKIFLAIIIVLAVVGAVFAIISNKKESKEPSNNQNQGQTQNQPPQGNEEITITSPLANSSISSPIQLTGKALNNWYFEASFPVTLLDEDGSVLAQSHVTAQSDWMTAGFVNFKGTLSFSQPKGKKGTLVFENDNPSGLEQNHKEFRLPINFANPVTLN